MVAMALKLFGVQTPNLYRKAMLFYCYNSLYIKFFGTFQQLSTKIVCKKQLRKITSYYFYCSFCFHFWWDYFNVQPQKAVRKNLQKSYYFISTIYFITIFTVITSIFKLKQQHVR